VIRFLSAIPLFLVSFLAYAMEDVAAPPPSTDVANMTPVIVFGVIFIGSIIWFFWFMWKKERDRKKREAGK
jgi:hypothetical protein